jgi:hypothetical protein
MRRLAVIFAVAALALCAIMAPAARAVTAPYFSIGGSRLVAGKTHNIYAKAYLPVTLYVRVFLATVECPGLRLRNGVLLGSNAGQPGTASEVAVLSQCDVAGLGPGCVVDSPIETAPLTSELVEIDRSGKEVLGEELKPAVGSKFASVKFEGECAASEFLVTGEVAGEYLTDEELEPIELGKAPKEAASWLVNFPSTVISSVLLVNTKGEKETVFLKEIEASGFQARLGGYVLTLLANTKFEPEHALWSPLP